MLSARGNLREANPSKQVVVDGAKVTIPIPFPSPADWRDQWIYFLMVDRFNNPAAPPKQLHYDKNVDEFQGGTLEVYVRNKATSRAWVLVLFDYRLR